LIVEALLAVSLLISLAVLVVVVLLESSPLDSIAIVQGGISDRNPEIQVVGRSLVKLLKQSIGRARRMKL